jgi:glutamine synthetase
MIRIPEAGRFEFRLADGAANPYLLPAALIASGLDGIKHQREAGKRYDNNSYTDPLPFGTVKQLPANLLDALRCLDANTILPDALGSEFVQSYIKLKQREWNDYSTRISPWELENTLDC